MEKTGACERAERSEGHCSANCLIPKWAYKHHEIIKQAEIRQLNFLTINRFSLIMKICCSDNNNCHYNR